MLIVLYLPVLLFVQILGGPFSYKAVPELLLLHNGNTLYLIYLLFFFSALTSYCMEDLLFSTNDLEVPIGDGVSILYYLQKMFPGSPLPCFELLISSLTIISVGKTDMLPHKMVIYYR